MNSPKQWHAKKSTPGKITLAKGVTPFQPMSGKSSVPTNVTKPNYCPVPSQG